MSSSQKIKTFAYVRVSSDDQNIQKDKADVMAYVERQGLPTPIQWFEDDGVSTKIHWHNRKLFQLTELVCEGDIVVTTEVSRLARNIAQVMEIMETLAKKGVVCHTIKNGWKFDDSATSKMLAAMFGYVAQMEKELMSARTKFALAERRRQGILLGRPPGVGSSRLDIHQSQILKWLADGVTKTEIARKLSTSVSNLNSYFRKRNMKPYRPPKVKIGQNSSISTSSASA